MGDCVSVERIGFGDCCENAFDMKTAEKAHVGPGGRKKTGEPHHRNRSGDGGGKKRDAEFRDGIFEFEKFLVLSAAK